LRIITLIIVISAVLSSGAEAQTILKLQDVKYKSEINNYNYFRLSDKKSDAGLPPVIAIAAIMLVINPELVIENRKVYFGLTKELSVGKYPYGRLAFEYTYIFRNFDRNHLRFSYNYDFIIQTKGDFYAPLASTGVGYFTDTEHKGVFVQGSAGIILPLPIGIFQGVYAYFKARHTFVKGTENSDINDFSLGMSFLIYY